MSEENKELSTWDQLVGELGVNVTDDALERRQPAPKELPSRRRGMIDREETAACPSDWEGLASSLGIEVPRVVEQPPIKEPDEGQVKKVSARESDSVTVETEEVQAEIKVESERVDSSEFIEQIDDNKDEAAESPRMTGEAARSAFDALFAADAASWGSAFVSPRTNVESSFLFSEGEEAVFADEIPDDSIEEEEEPKRGRRRRRRGGRGRGRGKTDAGAAGEGIEDAEIKEPADPSSEEPAEADLSEETAPPEKCRRRRRSRGRSRQKDSQELSADEEDSRIKKHVATHVGDDEDDEEDDSHADDDGESSSTGGSRTTHRNLPTWDEAIGVIVDTNLAQRSKSPAKQSTGSSRGRSRGGRRHKKS